VVCSETKDGADNADEYESPAVTADRKTANKMLPNIDPKITNLGPDPIYTSIEYILLDLFFKICHSGYL
jgi:hypothetical protein